MMHMRRRERQDGREFTIITLGRPAALQGGSMLVETVARGRHRAVVAGHEGRRESQVAGW